MIEYQILRRETADELVLAVNAYITQQGWEPLGGVGHSFVYHPDDGSPTALWFQALVKHTPNEPR